MSGTKRHGGSSDKIVNTGRCQQGNARALVILQEVNDVRSLRVSILGEVAKPGVLELRGQTTILEAIAMAGGFKDFASPSTITILRIDESGKTKRIRFNYNRAVSNGGDEENVVLRSGDVVVVP